MVVVVDVTARMKEKEKKVVFMVLSVPALPKEVVAAVIATLRKSAIARVRVVRADESGGGGGVDKPMAFAWSLGNATSLLTGPRLFLAALVSSLEEAGLTVAALSWDKQVGGTILLHLPHVLVDATGDPLAARSPNNLSSGSGARSRSSSGSDSNSDSDSGSGSGSDSGSDSGSGSASSSATASSDSSATTSIARVKKANAKAKELAKHLSSARNAAKHTSRRSRSRSRASRRSHNRAKRANPTHPSKPTNDTPTDTDTIVRFLRVSTTPDATPP